METGAFSFFHLHRQNNLDIRSVEKTSQDNVKKVDHVVETEENVFGWSSSFLKTPINSLKGGKSVCF